MLTNCAAYVNNNLMYIGGQGVYAPTFRYERSPECIVCGAGVQVETSADLGQPQPRPPSATLGTLGRPQPTLQPASSRLISAHLVCGVGMQVEIAGSAISRLYLGCISANSRLTLG